MEFPCSITLSDVCFTHLSAEKDTLKHINLTIQPGEKIAVVGLNGAWKTTLIKNICGLYKPTSGEIFINQTSALDFRHQDYGEYAKLFEIQSYYYQNDSNQEYESDLDPFLEISSYQR